MARSVSSWAPSASRSPRGERGLKYDSLASSCTLVDRRPPRRERPDRNHQDSFSIFSRTPTRDGEALTVYLWPIAKAIIKSTIENQQTPSFTLIRKYLQQLIINADKQGASKSREHITFISGRFSAFCYAVERHF